MVARNRTIVDNFLVQRVPPSAMGQPGLRDCLIYLIENHREHRPTPATIKSLSDSLLAPMVPHLLAFIDQLHPTEHAK